MMNCDNAKKCICKTKKNVEDFFEADWGKKEKSMVISIAVLFGIIIGFMLSPIKKGIFSNNKIVTDNTIVEPDYEESEDE